MRCSPGCPEFGNCAWINLGRGARTLPPLSLVRLPILAPELRPRFSSEALPLGLLGGVRASDEHRVVLLAVERLRHRVVVYALDAPTGVLVDVCVSSDGGELEQHDVVRRRRD